MNRDEFLSFADCVIETVHIPEMKTDLFVRSLSAGEKARWEYEPISVNNNGRGNTLTLTKDRLVTARERLVELAVCNEDGSRFFKDGDASAIGRKNANIISALFDVAARLSGITKADLEEVVKNSEGAQAEDLQSA